MITAYIYIYSRISAGDNSYLSPELRSQEYAALSPQTVFMRFVRFSREARTVAVNVPY